jgi:hypothetical protein
VGFLHLASVTAITTVMTGAFTEPPAADASKQLGEPRLKPEMGSEASTTNAVTALLLTAKPVRCFAAGYFARILGLEVVHLLSCEGGEIIMEVAAIDASCPWSGDVTCDGEGLSADGRLAARTSRG